MSQEIDVVAAICAAYERGRGCGTDQLRHLGVLVARCEDAEAEVKRLTVQCDALQAENARLCSSANDDMLLGRLVRAMFPASSLEYKGNYQSTPWKVTLHEVNPEQSRVFEDNTPEAALAAAGVGQAEETAGK